jgi:RNA polymerase sigma-70 factor (ECF subfamily)
MKRKDDRALPNDHETMLAIREGDLDRMTLLFERHNKHLYNFFLRMTACPEDSEDLVQEVFFRMLNYRHNYRDDSRFETWMFRIARNVRIDAHRRSRRAGPMPEERNLKNPDPSPEENLIKEDETDLLRRALSILADEKREVLLLSRFESMGFREIARILGSRESTVKVRAHRAVRELSEIYQRLEKGEIK